MAGSVNGQIEDVKLFCLNEAIR